MSTPTLPNVKRILSAARTYKMYARRHRRLARELDFADLNRRAQFAHAHRMMERAKVTLLYYIETGEFAPPHLAAKRKAKKS